MSPAAKIILLIAAIDGLLAVVFGAFGAHALKARLAGSPLLSAYQTGVQYQFYHVFALLAVGILLARDMNMNPTLLMSAGLLFALGTVLFSGSLYGLALGGPGWLGPVTPVGGTLFIIGWAILAVAVVRS